MCISGYACVRRKCAALLSDIISNTHSGAMSKMIIRNYNTRTDNNNGNRCAFHLHFIHEKTNKKRAIRITCFYFVLIY